MAFLLLTQNTVFYVLAGHETTAPQSDQYNYYYYKMDKKLDKKLA